MKYAVIKTGGKQYKVTEGDVLEVDNLNAKEGAVTFDNVLLLVSDEHVEIGKPFIVNAKVKAKLLENKKGEKVRVAKFKSKVRYRRAVGFRASVSKIQIEKIEGIKEIKTVVKKQEKPKKVSRKA